MSELFIDTSGWAAFLVRSEPFHLEARFLLNQHRRNGQSVVTTNYVFAELIALLTSPMRVARSEQVRIVETLRASNWIKVIHIDAAQDEAAWRLLAAHNDKTWSLADCASFVVMKERSITTALTTDHHFEQAGLIRLLK